MRSALRHPGRTLRWWRYRIGFALAHRRQVLAQITAARRVRSAAKAEPAPPPRPDRGEVVGRAFIGRDGEMKAIPLAEHDDRFDQRPALIPRDADGRLRW